jgi:hypothetical protein
MVVVKDREQLMKLYEEGYRIYKSVKGKHTYFTAQKGRQDRVSIHKSLNPLAEELMKKQRGEPGQPANPSNTPSSTPSQPGGSGQTPGSTDTQRARDLAQTQMNPRKPLEEREIEDQAWYKNMAYETGRYVLHKLWGELSPTEEELSLEKWESFFKRVCTRFDEVYGFWKSQPNLRDIEFERNHYRLKYDALMAAAQRMRVALAQQHQLLQACMALMDKRSLEKLTVLMAMVDLSRVLPPDIDRILKLDKAA